MAEALSFQPSDQVQRDRILTDLDSTLFVEAGAGTGKTASLVERILRLVATGRAEMRRIAAITFTEKAAAELRDRVREEMEKAARDGKLPEGETVRIREAIGDIDAAAIETLHGFAQRILTAYPLEAGLPPAVSVKDEVVSSIAFEERWRDYLDSLLENAALEEVLVRGYLLGLDLGQLRALALALHENWDRVEDVELPKGELAPVDAQPLIAAIDKACSHGNCCINQSDYLYQHLNWVKTYRARANRAENQLDTLRVLAEPRKLSHSRGNQGNWQGVTPTEIRAVLLEAQDSRQALLDEQRAAVLEALLVELRGFVLSYAEERQREGQLEFHDLLVLARDLLRHHPSVRHALRAQFSHLLIDEFQDTDPIQIELAVLLACGETESAPSDWREAEVEEGRLFFVGDPKQSIYRFRRADITLYRRVQEKFSDRTIYLTQNFRSCPSAIDWVNAVFHSLIGDGDAEGQPPYVALDCSWEADGDSPTVRLVGEPSDENVPVMRRREAQEIAAVIRQATAEGWLVTGQNEQGAREVRPTRYADIAILLPTRTSLPSLERALDESGIPYRVESKDLLYDTQEVRDLLTILRSIDDPTDEVALVAALRTPAFACADDDLLRYSQAGGRWDYRQQPPTALGTDHPVVSAMAALNELHNQRWWRPLNEVVEAAIRERRLFELAFAHGRPRERWQRLRFVLDQARAFAEAGGATLRQFVEWAELQAEEGMRVVETVVPEADDDAVRILTVHASKGLEFPIVILAGLNSTTRGGRPGPKVLWGSDGRPEVQLGSENARFQTSGFEQLAEVEQRMDEYEKVRLLYVAATRARDHLVVSLHHKSGTQCAASTLGTLCEGIPALWTKAEITSLPPKPPSDVRSSEYNDSPEQRAHWLQERESRIASLSRAPVYAATAISRELAVSEDPNLKKDAPVEEIPPWRRGRAGTAMGRAVHAVLQSIDLATGEGLASAAAAQAAAEGISDRAGEIERAVRATLDSPSVKAAVSSGRYWREVYVAAPVDGALVEGFIDLLYETPEGFVVVDYKTDRVPSEAELDAALDRYRLQGAAYALALTETLGRPVAACRFVFVSTTRSVERELPDLIVAIGEARALVAEGTAATAAN
jgi:ATP-dependent helicase/nuclease subunit A